MKCLDCGETINWRARRCPPCRETFVANRNEDLREKRKERSSCGWWVFAYNTDEGQTVKKRTMDYSNRELKGEDSRYRVAFTKGDE